MSSTLTRGDHARSATLRGAVVITDSPASQHILERSGLFYGVSAEARTGAIAQLDSMTFPRGTRIFLQDEPGDRLFIIVSGKVKIGRRGPGGRENLLAVMGPSDMFGELAVFDPGPRTSTATALTSVHAMAMDRAALRSWWAEHPEITDQLLQLVARRLRRTTDAYVDMVFVDVPGRVAQVLLVLGERFGTMTRIGLLVDHDLTQAELAQLVGAARETVSKALADFERRGWIRQDGRTVLITDTARFTQRAGLATGAGAHRGR